MIRKSNPKPYRGGPVKGRVATEIKKIFLEREDIVPRFQYRGLTYIWKSARLITGTRSVYATYRLEGHRNAPRK